jgi:hypothetical protein
LGGGGVTVFVCLSVCVCGVCLCLCVVCVCVCVCMLCECVFVCSGRAVEALRNLPVSFAHPCSGMPLPLWPLPPSVSMRTPLPSQYFCDTRLAAPGVVNYGGVPTEADSLYAIDQIITRQTIKL